MEETGKPVPGLLPVTLPQGMTEREASEFAEGLGILERLARLARETARRLEREQRADGA